MREYLNRSTNYFLNFNRVGNLFFTNHHYSCKEVFDRVFIGISAVVGGLLAYKNSEANGGTHFVIGASLAFLSSHALVISPLIYKKLRAKWDCDALIENIKTQLESHDENFQRLGHEVIDKILAYEATKSPSAVWGARRRLLKTLETWVDEEDYNDLERILQDEDIITTLQDKRTRLSLRTK